MAGLIVTWDEDELRAVDEDNFEAAVVSVIDGFFESVDSYQSVTVEWSTEHWDHGSEYEIVDPPLMQINKYRYFITIRGKSRGGEYQLELKPSALTVEKLSTNQVQDLTFLTLRAPDVAVDANALEIATEEIPQKIRDRVLNSVPRIGDG